MCPADGVLVLPPETGRLATDPSSQYGSLVRIEYSPVPRLFWRLARRDHYDEATFWASRAFFILSKRSANMVGGTRTFTVSIAWY